MEYKVVEVDVVVGGGDTDLISRIRLMTVPISPGPITLRTCTAGSVLQKRRMFDTTKVNNIDLPTRIRVIPLQ